MFISVLTLQMAEELMAKLPDVFKLHFLKEGVAHAVDTLVVAQPPVPAEPRLRAEEGRRRSGGARPASRSADRSVDGGRVAELGARPAAGGDAMLRAAIATRARAFRDSHFVDAGGQPMGCDTAGSRVLAGIAGRLGNDPLAPAALLEALAATGDAAVSTFELLSSGLVEALRAHLGGEDLSNRPGRDTELLARLGAFSRAALPEGSGGAPPMEVLVSKLLAALAASEKFAVQLHPVTPVPSLAAMMGYFRPSSELQRSTSAASSSLAAGLAALSNPLKIRLARCGDEAALRDYSSNHVLIEPLATMVQVEDFLFPRVGTGPGERTSAAREAARGRSGDNLRSREARASRGGSAHGGGGGGGTVPEPSVNCAGGGSSATASGRPGNGSTRPPSQNRPIPSRRMTRAQARAAAEAEPAGQAMDEDAPEPVGHEGMDVMDEEGAEELLVGGSEEHDYGEVLARPAAALPTCPAAAMPLIIAWCCTALNLLLQMTTKMRRWRMGTSRARMRATRMVSWGSCLAWAMLAGWKARCLPGTVSCSLCSL